MLSRQTLQVGHLQCSVSWSGLSSSPCALVILFFANLMIHMSWNGWPQRRLISSVPGVILSWQPGQSFLLWTPCSGVVLMMLLPNQMSCSHTARPSLAAVSLTIFFCASVLVAGENMLLMSWLPLDELALAYAAIRS